MCRCDASTCSLLAGSSDFSIEQYNVTLESRGNPGSKARFTVRFKSRVSRPVEARVVFSSAGEADAAAATLVFALRSAVTTRQAIATHNAQAKCYELANILAPVSRCGFLALFLPSHSLQLTRRSPTSSITTATSRFRLWWTSGPSTSGPSALSLQSEGLGPSLLHAAHLIVRQRLRAHFVVCHPPRAIAGLAGT